MPKSVSIILRYNFCSDETAYIQRGTESSAPLPPFSAYSTGRNTFQSRSHELVNADAAMVRVDVSALRAGNQVECALVGVGDRVCATDRVIVGGADTVAADTPSVHAVFTAAVTLHLTARVCKQHSNRYRRLRDHFDRSHS